MKKIALLQIVVIGLALTLGVPTVNASSKIEGTKLENTPEAREAGRLIYFRRCSFCHGLLGDGNGPAAQFMAPRPRDFTLGTFKFRTTDSGELPLDEDLFKTVSLGLPGSGMQAFDNDIIKNGLTQDERLQVIHYIKTFAMEFDDPDLDPYLKIIPLPSSMPTGPEVVEKGKAVYERAKCWECHGKLGRGNGQKDNIKKDDWGFPVRIRDVTSPWRYRSGAEAEDIYMRFSTGIMGTPMPSFADALSDDDRWALAVFVKSLHRGRSDKVVMKANLIVGDIPMDPAAEIWSQSVAIDVRLAGQVVAAPRWQNPAIDLVTVRSVYNENEIAFLLEWNDPFEDLKHDSSKELDTTELLKVGNYNSYVNPDTMVPRTLETFRDSIALQFPVKIPGGTKKPHFFRGNGSSPVTLWKWHADKQSAGEPAVTDNTSRGFKQPMKPQGEGMHQVVSEAKWEEGRWTVILKRALKTEDKNDIQFVKGKFIPLAVNAWDGANGEHGLLMGLSTWHYVFLEAPTPKKIYLYALAGIIVTGLGEFYLLRIWRRRD